MESRIGIVAMIGGIIMNAAICKSGNVVVSKSDIELSHKRCKKFRIDPH